jgi:argininosuccinate synthase
MQYAARFEGPYANMQPDLKVIAPYKTKYT